MLYNLFAIPESNMFQGNAKLNRKHLEWNEDSFPAITGQTNEMWLTWELGIRLRGVEAGE